MTDLELGWAAGIVDGEGCIFISYKKPAKRAGSLSPSYILIVRVAMCHKPTVDRMRELFGVGTVHICTKSKKYSQAWQWVVQANAAKSVLERIEPHLLTRRYEAQLGLRFSGLEKFVGGGRRVPTPLLRVKHALYIRMRRAKGRAKFTLKKYPIRKLA